MCEHCHENPCAPGCPCYVPKYYGDCKICGRAINEAEDYIELVHDPVHLECLIDLIGSDPLEAFDMLGVSCYRAGDEDE